jgi:hypothetical protein
VDQRCSEDQIRAADDRHGPICLLAALTKPGHHQGMIADRMKPIDGPTRPYYGCSIMLPLMAIRGRSFDSWASTSSYVHSTVGSYMSCVDLSNCVPWCSSKAKADCVPWCTGRGGRLLATVARRTVDY